MADNHLDLDGEFVEKVWIGVGKKYDDKIPLFVLLEKGRQTDIPEKFFKTAKLPSPDLSVQGFLAFKLPRVSSEIISTKAKLWFSHAHPSANYKHVLFARSLPSQESVEQLGCVVGQAWLDGTKSVVDHQYNDGRDNLPLWTVAFWKEIIKLDEMQHIWAKSLTWLEHEAEWGPAQQETRSIQNLLELLPWNTKLKYCRGETTTFHLSRFLGIRWLSDDNINMMAKELQDELQGHIDIRIANLSLAGAICDIKKNLGLPPLAPQKWQKSLLGQFEHLTKTGGLQKLYFPIHINSNHWIAAEIDFQTKTITFG
jgi:hypothetical protein